MVDVDDPILLLDTNTVHVDPGGEARLTVTVYNPTTIVEEYTVEVLGGPGGHRGAGPPDIMPGEHPGRRRWSASRSLPGAAGGTRPSRSVRQPLTA